MKKRKISIKKIIRFIIVLIIVAILSITACKYILDANKPKAQVKVEDEIKGYGYKLDDNETGYYKGLFKKLKTTLEKGSVDEDKYASLVSQLFIADFLNLNNKNSKNDVGGIQFIYKDFRSDFSKIAKEGIYNSVVNDKKENKNMPEVTEVKVVNLEHLSYDYLDKTDENAIKTKLKITYKKDLEYQSTTELTLVHNGKKLEIVEMTEK